jgi:3-hydroxy acid dehydrogenase/malonic semialdehyde reductase
MLKDKIVFITGASSGIGEALAYAFAKAGAKLLLCARNEKSLLKVAETCKKLYGVEIHTFLLDVRQYSVVSSAWNTLPKHWKNIDILVNNAGLALGLETLQDADIADWEVMIDTNVKGLLYVTKMVLPGMIAKNSGHIINIGSIAGHEVYPRGAVYCATKHAVNVLTRGLRMDVFNTKIRVSTVDPGACETNFSLVRFKGEENKAKSVYAGMTPLTAEDVADSVLYCATRPLHVNVSEIILMPTSQASVSMIAREPVN